MDVPSTSTVSTADQMLAYQTGAAVYGHIIEIQGHLTTFGNFFLLVCGALWAAIAQDRFPLPDHAKLIILTVHLVSSVAALQVIASNLNAINLRHTFLQTFGARYYPDLEKIGQESFRRTYGEPTSFKARFARWGRQRLVWYLIPISGFAGSAFFIYVVSRSPL